MTQTIAATEWPVNELGEIVLHLSEGSSNVTSHLHNSLVPVDAVTGKVAMKLPISIDSVEVAVTEPSIDVKFPHNLGRIPKYVNVVPTGGTSAIPFSVAWNEDVIRVKFADEQANTTFFFSFIAA